VPALQWPHELTPRASLNVPAAHLVGSLAPSVHELPTGQAWQPSCDASAVVFPKLPDSHGLGVTDPSSQWPPRLQTQHDVAPSPPWYEPASQRVHLALLALGAAVPATHGAGSVAPSEHEWPGGHAVQLACEASPLVLPYDPGAQSVGIAKPTPQYPPCVHSMHPAEAAPGWNLPVAQLSHAVCPVESA